MNETVPVQRLHRVHFGCTPPKWPLAMQHIMMQYMKNTHKDNMLVKISQNQCSVYLHRKFSHYMSLTAIQLVTSTLLYCTGPYEHSTTA